jgi:hypothetical protein
MGQIRLSWRTSCWSWRKHVPKLLTKSHIKMSYKIFLKLSLHGGFCSVEPFLRNTWAWSREWFSWHLYSVTTTIFILDSPWSLGTGHLLKIFYHLHWCIHSQLPPIPIRFSVLFLVVSSFISIQIWAMVNCGKLLNIVAFFWLVM